MMSGTAARARDQEQDGKELDSRLSPTSPESMDERSSTEESDDASTPPTPSAEDSLSIDTPSLKSNKPGTSNDQSHDMKPPTRRLSSSQLHNGGNSPLKPGQTGLINTTSSSDNRTEPPTQNLTTSRRSSVEGGSGTFVPIGTPTPGHAMSPPMAYMVEHMKSSDNMSLSRYVELMTLQGGTGYNFIAHQPPSIGLPSHHPSPHSAGAIMSPVATHPLMTHPFPNPLPPQYIDSHHINNYIPVGGRAAGHGGSHVAVSSGGSGIIPALVPANISRSGGYQKPHPSDGTLMQESRVRGHTGKLSIGSSLMQHDFEQTSCKPPTKHHPVSSSPPSSSSSSASGGPRTRRKRSHPNQPISMETPGSNGSSTVDTSGGGVGRGVVDDSVPPSSGIIPTSDLVTPTALSSSQSQQLKWQAHVVNTWNDVCDAALQDIQRIGFHVETDKGFNFSVVDDSFVCQKKNHFQVTVSILFHRTPKFVKLKDGSIQPIERFHLDLHGIRFEQVNSVILLEQSKTDRKKVKFEPDIIDIPVKPDEPVRKTICRLHFSETTQNNMRKRGKPNPDQRHFSLVVALYADTANDSFLVVAHVSERIIVRASNPGNFDNDNDYSWFKSPVNSDVVYHHGRVGVNTDKPDESLVVNGNIQVTGQIVQVSDLRVKRDIREVKSGGHLENLSKLQLYEYHLDNSITQSYTTPNMNSHDQCIDNMASHVTTDSARSAVCLRSRKRHTLVGVLAQDVGRVLPNAVRETQTSLSLDDGTAVPNLLVVDKDQLLMETIGAVQELRHINHDLQAKLTALEGRCGNITGRSEASHLDAVNDMVSVSSEPCGAHQERRRDSPCKPKYNLILISCMLLLMVILLCSNTAPFPWLFF